MWGATTCFAKAAARCHISIHAPRVGRDSLGAKRCTKNGIISIHAPRVGRDDTAALLLVTWISISIHAPRVGRDRSGWSRCGCSRHFNPRAPCGARHSRSPPGCRSLSYFNPRAPCGARRYGAREDGDSDGISIHAPRVGRDFILETWTQTAGEFQSTRPVWGATRSRPTASATSMNFNPRAPCGARRVYVSGRRSDVISIHAPRVGRDFHPRNEGFACAAFQSTRPVWGATANLTILPRQICTKGTKEFLLGRKTHGKKEKQSKSLLTFTHFRPFWGAKVPELSARLYFAPNTARLSARLRHHSPLWHRNARCGCDTYPQGSKSAGCPRIHP